MRPTILAANTKNEALSVFVLSYKTLVTDGCWIAARRNGGSVPDILFALRDRGVSTLPKKEIVKSQGVRQE